MFLKHTVSKSTVKQMLAKLCVYRLKAQPALYRGRGSEERTSNKCFLVVFADIVFKFGTGILGNLLIVIFNSQAYVFWMQC